MNEGALAGGKGKGRGRDGGRGGGLGPMGAGGEGRWGRVWDG